MKVKAEIVGSLEYVLGWLRNWIIVQSKSNKGIG